MIPRDFTNPADPANEYELFDLGAPQAAIVLGPKLELSLISSLVGSLAPSDLSRNDLDADPFEIKNLYTTASEHLKASLHARLEKLYRCQGTACN
eukprot:SAG11_NODE_1945_length_4019_cov_6.325510_5_plen_95_part_00